MEAITAIIKFCIKSKRLLIAVISVLMTAIWVLIFSSLSSVRAFGGGDLLFNDAADRLEVVWG